MTRDYAKKSRTRPASSGRSRPAANKRSAPPPSGPSTWQWLTVVAVTSAFVGFVVYLNAVPPETSRNTASYQPPVELVKPAPPATKPTPREPEYRFYEMLPKSEVVPPEVEAYNTGKGQRQKFEYVLQTGSFRTMGDAQRQKAQIGFQGLRADVSQVNLDSGDTWYRVQVGPYQSRSTMNSVIDRLVAINIQPLVRKKALETATP
ncbi:SPOR domain-containing protein [Hydrocarboniclastica marina]|uniref:Sporulation protein n=1 Tax=Hydrocarboniclastica marina TaxID=2259620 RepID=A0A4P7XE15_9ALTE|nr:SPOR domain-containing protein [Hydrocarboniclastica marina]QCF25066.1 sporulation protein [Hydrocarboniclastica marina]